MLARAYQANGQPGLAEEALRAAMDSSPGDISVRIELAQLLARTQRSDQAVSLLEQGVTREPKDSTLRVALIEAYLAKHDFGSAYNAAQDLKTLAPKAAQGAYLAGLAAQGEKKLDVAQKELEQALQLQPGASEPLAALARLDLARGQGGAAIDLVQKAIAAGDPKDATPVNLLGEVYLANKNVPQAVETLSRAVSLAPSWWPARRNLALAKAAANDLEGAIAAYDAAIKVAPNESQLVVELAQLEEGRGRVDAAIARYEELHRRNPHLQLAANNLAMLLATYKKDRQSLDRARDLTAGFESSNSSELLDTYGWVHFKRGEYAQALPVLERAAERSPEGREIRYHLGMAELQAGQRDRARTNLEAAAAGAVKYPWSDDARAVLAGLKDQTG
jgi:Flp pilus assembly protein TadD